MSHHIAGHATFLDTTWRSCPSLRPHHIVACLLICLSLCLLHHVESKRVVKPNQIKSCKWVTRFALSSSSSTKCESTIPQVKIERRVMLLFPLLIFYKFLSKLTIFLKKLVILFTIFLKYCTFVHTFLHNKHKILQVQWSKL